MNEINEWTTALQQIHLPRWEEFPTIELYMDQVLEYLEDCLAPAFSIDQNRLITAAMINNYVKQKLMPAPIKKRYCHQHLAYIIVITILKQVITIQDISLGIQQQRKQYGAQNAYNLFVSEFERSALAFAEVLSGRSIIFEHQGITVNQDLPMHLAIFSYISRMAAIRLQKAYQQQSTEETQND